MAKKPRSQRRKKGSNLGEQTDAADAADAASVDVELLSESHTVAETLSTMGDDFEEDALLDHDDVDSDVLLQGSPAASTQAATAAANRHARLMDALSSLPELATEKQSARREGQLRRVFRALTQFATGPAGREAVEDAAESLVAACVHGLLLRAGVAKPAEQYAACRVLEAAAVVLGGNREDYAESIERPLRRVVDMTGRAAPVRGAALRTLALTNFMCEADDVKTEALLDLCEMVAAETYRNETVPASLRATALDCWALLSTTIQEEYIADCDDSYMGRGLVLLPLLKECLETNSVDLRSAAGECVALIHECRLNLGIDDKQAEMASATERRYRRGSWDGSEWEILMDEVKQRIAELSVESGHHMSKKAKKAQRATFREFMSTIVDDESPCEVVTFRGGTLTLESWREVVQLNFIRHCLQGGFQIQLLTNATLHEVFGANGRLLNDASGASMSSLEKRLMLSKSSEASKAADMKRTKNRRVRTNVKNHFLTADGEDI